LASVLGQSPLKFEQSSIQQHRDAPMFPNGDEERTETLSTSRRPPLMPKARIPSRTRPGALPSRRRDERVAYKRPCCGHARRPAAEITEERRRIAAGSHKRWAPSAPPSLSPSRCTTSAQASVLLRGLECYVGATTMILGAEFRCFNIVCTDAVKHVGTCRNTPMRDVRWQTVLCCARGQWYARFLQAVPEEI
jgi:hypothetical protein